MVNDDSGMSGPFERFRSRQGRTGPLRASRIHAVSGGGSLWMGGVNSVSGSPIDPKQLDGAHVIDCAGELPDAFRHSAALWSQCYFADVRSSPAQFARIKQLASIAARDLEHGDVLVFCRFGNNRSGLVAGLTLRELGFSGQEAIVAIRSKRPGALANLDFLDLVATYRPSVVDEERPSEEPDSAGE